jgi:basic membrane lipoprotein Med (substrate-binding protein (PBP1-ABC) superfamily)
LHDIHLKEGIRDPIKVYEYLNWFYVVEGNKRVSVLKYFDAYSIPAVVTRLVPKKDENNLMIKIYYEFLAFNKMTGIYDIWFSRENAFEELGQYLEKYDPKVEIYTNKYNHFMQSVYNPFRKIYHNAGGDKLQITTADALLEYIKVYGIPDEIDPIKEEPLIRKFMTELIALSKKEVVDVRTEPLKEPKRNVIQSITSFVAPKKKLKAAFVYAETIQTSGWSYAHELGRLHIENVLGDQVETSYVENVPQTIEAYDYLKDLAEENNDIIFTTSPTYINATLKAALEYPNVKFLNCSQTHSFRHVNTYFGRSYEPKFLAGLIAGSVTKSDKIGYVGTYPICEVVAGINAFALGVKMVNPYAKVKVKWTHGNTYECGEEVIKELKKTGADIIAHNDLPRPGKENNEFGLYSSISNAQFASPIWDWGIFYEKLLRNVLSGTWRMVFDVLNANPKLVNFWWGMDSGIVDIIYSKTHVPRQTQKLVDFMKKMIIQNEFHPFSGPIYNQKGSLIIKEDEAVNYEQILSMDWFIDIVEGEIPNIDNQQGTVDPLTEMLGIKK